MFSDPVSGFNAIVTNPPFLGGIPMVAVLGESYKAYLMRYVSGGASGKVDLVAHFARRAVSLVPDGLIGFLATDSISQGDTRDAGLRPLLESGTRIIRAVESLPWPGDATVDIAEVWLCTCGWNGQVILNGASVKGINSFLRPQGRATGEAFQLIETRQKAFQGVIPLGEGFFVEPEEADRMLKEDPSLGSVLAPYLSGADINSRPDHSPSRWVIDFVDLSAEEAQGYGLCWDKVERDVRPDRLTKPPPSLRMRPPPSPRS